MPFQTQVTAHLDELVVLLTYLAVITSALSGALEARHREMDVVGAITVAFVTAFGGGTLRDLLLGRTPIFWLLDPWLTVATFVTAVAADHAVRHVSDRLLVVPDALGLGLFSVLGATYALQMKLPVIVAVLMGVITGIFGGVLRDTLCNSVPTVFRRNTGAVRHVFVCWRVGVHRADVGDPELHARLLGGHRHHRRAEAAGCSDAPDAAGPHWRRRHGTSVRRKVRLLSTLGTSQADRTRGRPKPTPTKSKPAPTQSEPAPRKQAGPRERADTLNPRTGTAVLRQSRRTVHS